MMLNVPTQFPTLIVTGMHRSGTSLTASLLESAGVNIGEELMSANQANLKGYFENMDFVDFHERVLLHHGIPKEGWTLDGRVSVPEHLLGQARDLILKNQAGPAWGWKDPRTTLFLDFWAELLPSAKFIFIHRSPWEVIDSLYRRGSLGDEIFVDNPRFAIDLWASYNRTILDFYRNNQEKCLLFNLDTISSKQEYLVDAIEKKFGVELNDIENLYDESLITRSISWHRIALICQHFPEVFDLYEKLNQLADIPHDENLSPETIEKIARCRLCDQDRILRDWLSTRLLEMNLKRSRQQIRTISAGLTLYGDQLNNWDAQQYYHPLPEVALELEHYHQKLDVIHSDLEVSQNQWDHLRSELSVCNQRLMTTRKGPEDHADEFPISDLELRKCQLQLESLKKEIIEYKDYLQAYYKEIKFLQGEKLFKDNSVTSPEPYHQVDEVLVLDNTLLSVFKKFLFKIKEKLTMS